jgi:hypothetical protein
MATEGLTALVDAMERYPIDIAHAKRATESLRDDSEFVPTPAAVHQAAIRTNTRTVEFCGKCVDGWVQVYGTVNGRTYSAVARCSCVQALPATEEPRARQSAPERVNAASVEALR